jgi:DNA recombination protein Rad52
MGFADTQVRQLKAKLDPKHIRIRHAGGATLHYIEGWHAIAEANRIFGFDGWNRETISISCVSNGKSRGDYLVAYIAKVRITIRAGDTVIVREGSGAGEAKAFTPGQAHELAVKSAETDATKRALASFGNRFGLALYDPEQLGVKNGRSGKATFDGASQSRPWTFRSATGEVISSFDAPKDFDQALRKGLSGASSLEDLYGLWQQNVETVRALHRLYRWNTRLGIDGITLVAHLKACARCFADPRKKNSEGEGAGQKQEASFPLPVAIEWYSPRLPTKIDKSVLTIAEPKRIRTKEHLRFVAQQPCVICGRRPSHAHHVRYAQPRGLALRVSDEFTVPLCAIHHSDNHATGDDRAWWHARAIDPLAVARELWLTSQDTSNKVRNK